MSDQKKPSVPSPSPAKPPIQKPPTKIQEGYRPVEEKKGYTPTSSQTVGPLPKPPKGGTGQSKGTDEKK